MQELRRLVAAEQARELDLAAGRLQQILAADNERDALDDVVDGRGTLIHPVPVAIANQQIAALVGRPLLLRPETEIHESLDRRLEPHAQPDAGAFRDTASAAC